MKRCYTFFIIFLLFSCALSASEGLQSVPMTHEVTRLLLELGIIIIAAKIGGGISKRIKLPSLLGEVFMGLLLSPYAFGALPMLGFPDGIIPLSTGAFPISLHLYGFAAVGAVIHVLVVGLESDFELFTKTGKRGLAVAIGSSLLSLIVGILIPVYFLGYDLLDRRVFFFASLSVSTSLGVQARILNTQNRMGTPEGAAIVSSSLMQDGFSIVFLAIAMAIGSLDVAFRLDAQEVWRTAVPVALIAIGILVGGAIVSFLCAPFIARVLKERMSSNRYTVVIVGIALFVSGLFETFGVAAIIGAYIIGISFSRTDFGDLLEEKTQPISEFFVPILYVSMGMLIDYRLLFKPEILFPGIAFALISGIAKVIGSGLPALGTGFNLRGALRIGLGTVPRGEVALIIASVGLALGDLSVEIFQIMVIMIVLSVAVGAPALAFAFKSPLQGTRGKWGEIQTEITHLDLPNEELSDLMIDGLVRVAQDDGFFVHKLELAQVVYRLRKDEVYITVQRKKNTLEIISDPQDAGIAKTLLYEVIIHVRDRVARISDIVVPEALRRDVTDGCGRSGINLAKYIFPESVIMNLLGDTKETVIGELVDRLAELGKISHKNIVMEDIFDREATVSTGMDRGIAIPHARTDGAFGICVAVGVSKKGVDFQSIDGKAAHLIFLIIAPKDDRSPHLQLLASIAKQMRCDERRTALLSATSVSSFLNNLFS